MEAAGSLVFPLFIILIFYLLVFRPQQQKMKAHANMVANIRRGDIVVTQGGIIGKVTKVKDKEANEVEIQVSDGVAIRVVQSTIADVRSKTEPAK